MSIFSTGCKRRLDNFVDHDDLPESIEKKYGAQIAYIDDLKKRAKEEVVDVIPNGEGGYPTMTFTVVKKIKPIPLPGVRTFSNHIFIENFGTVTLGEIEVGIKNGHSPHLLGSNDSQTEASGSNYFTLDMLKMRLGCPTTGNTNGPTANANGSQGPST